MTVATYNAASLRPRMPLILDWLAENEPDLLAIQETKIENEKFPFGEFEDVGYHAVVNGQKSWNGVATLTRSAAARSSCGFGDDLMPNDARLLTCEVDGVVVINTYVPNGSSVGSEKFAYKLQWLDRFARYLRENFQPDQPLLWLGDINIAPTSDDVYNPRRFFGGVGHHPEEFKRLDRITSFGLTDVFRKFHRGNGYYTYWDFVIVTSVEKNFGWRIDHIYATQPLADRCRSCTIDLEARKRVKPSDHTFVVAEFDI